ncbi:hypothetical protein [Lysinibacillus sphaericus]|nr:hypothetical protein [Lysinibacillus sphaericus]
MGTTVARRCILFTGDAHDTVKFDFTKHQIETFITLWNLGLPIQKNSQD